MPTDRRLFARIASQCGIDPSCNMEPTVRNGHVGKGDHLSILERVGEIPAAGRPVEELVGSLGSESL